MQLDKTRIAIRERSFVDILDLALAVLREHAAPLGLALIAGAVPAALFNHWLLRGWLLEGAFDPDDLVGYCFMLSLLICWELPLATAPITLYLGQALFVERPSAGKLMKDFFASLPQMLLYEVFLRAAIVCLVILIPVLFLGWPYLGEIILLERNPWRKLSPAGTSTLTRSGNMHGRNRGELFNRWIGALLVGALLVFVFWRSLWYLVRLLAGQVEDVVPQFNVWLQVALWLVIGFFAIVRFLSYLDLRIRTEGWEVELLLRAEAARLTRQIS
jgi:flagellar biosynthesis protein FlhB